MPYLSLFSFRGQLGPKVFLVNQLVFKIKTGASVSGVRGLPVWWVSPIRAKVNVRFNECKLHFSDLLSAAVPLHSHVRADCGRKPRLGSGDALDGQWACPCGDIATGGLGKRRCACLKVSLDVVPVTILLWSFAHTQWSLAVFVLHTPRQVKSTFQDC